MDHGFFGWNFQHLPVYNFQAKGVSSLIMNQKAIDRRRFFGYNDVETNVESIMAAPGSGIGMSLAASSVGK